jgi:hypothetical protein
MGLRGSVGKEGQNLPQDVVFVQMLLNRGGFFDEFDAAGCTRFSFRLPENGKVTDDMIAMIEDLQRFVVRRDHPDGLVEPGKQTWQALLQAAGLNRPVAWGRHATFSFRAKVVEIASDLGTDPDFLMAAMAFETGEAHLFSPTVTNAIGAVGLIQFMPATAQGLGTTTAELKTMTALQQLDFVKKHLAPKKGKLKSIDDLYMMIFHQDAVGKPDDYVPIDKDKDPVGYEANKPLDTNKDGKITKKEAASKVREMLEKGLKPEHLG